MTLENVYQVDILALVRVKLGMDVSVNNEYLYSTLGRRMRMRRLELGMTQAQLAASADILRTSIANIEAGRQKAPLHVLYKVSAALDIDLLTVLPSVADVVQRNTVFVEQDESIKATMPKAALFLRQLLDEASQRT